MCADITTRSSTLLVLLVNSVADSRTRDPGGRERESYIFIPIALTMKVIYKNDRRPRFLRSPLDPLLVPVSFNVILNTNYADLPLSIFNV